MQKSCKNFGTLVRARFSLSFSCVRACFLKEQTLFLPRTLSRTYTHGDMRTGQRGCFDTIQINCRVLLKTIRNYTIGMLSQPANGGGRRGPTSVTITDTIVRPSCNPHPPLPCPGPGRGTKAAEGAMPKAALALPADGGGNAYISRPTYLCIAI